jgi:ABC-type sulfate transport system permease component
LILRLILILGVIALVLIALTPRPDPSQLQTRSRAFAIALRKTLFTVAACAFALAGCFGLWHGWRLDDRAALTLAGVAALLAAAFGWLAYRVDRRPARR